MKGKKIEIINFTKHSFSEATVEICSFLILFLEVEEFLKHLGD